jgi:predicted nucleic acid-binding protein
MMRVLIDSDVLLDFFFDRAPHADHTEQLLTLCQSQQVKGFVTPVICSNMYYLLRRNADHNKVVGKLRQLLTIVDVLHMDSHVVMQALNSEFKDFEDALQHHAAIDDGTIQVIITRNVKDYRNSSIAVQTCEDFLKLLKG